ncbi:Post-GPI attachment to proteins factor 6 [Chionoecetes opilio]|uniref:Post-GPI attachment to proteins factor 6 n=1 Tax=Chionoecetes opilio TaxID=41210 RepID=A0A8J4XPB3_CHIOP|nr:Post-GPI attachment to proteins factor 6 [Chionoecetes opilio]
MCTGVRVWGHLLLLAWVVCTPGASSPTSQPHVASTSEASEGTLREVLAERQVLAGREVLAGRQVYSYRSYKDVQIFHFSIPPQVSQSVYNFTANDSLACEPRNITIFLQAHSYPVINPDRAVYPPGLWVNRSRMYEVHLRSDLKPAILSVQYPVAGDWFMVAFINEASNRITQAVRFAIALTLGLFPSCHSWLQAKVTHQQQGDVTTVVPEIHAHQEIQLFQKIEDSQYYRFYVPSATWMVMVNISNCLAPGDKNESCPINIAFRARALPDFESTDTVFHNCSDDSSGNTCIVEFIPEEEVWHYLHISAASSAPVQLGMAVKLQFCGEVGGSSYHLLSKVNLDQLSPEDSIVDFNTTFTIYTNDSEELSQATTSQEGTIKAEPVIFMPVSKTKQLAAENCWPRHNLVKKTFGGNFVFEYDLPPNENGSVPLLLDISNTSPTLLAFNLESITDIGGTLVIELAISPFINNNNTHNISVAGCVTRGKREEPDEDGACVRGHHLLVNTSSHDTKGTSLSIPFPEPGLWYLTLRPWCYLLNASEVVECSEQETSILFHISSASCLDGKCGTYGSCYQYISGGFIFSTCVCDAGYRGWGCTDDAQATPNWELLLSTLLLTLSNLFFLPAIILALKRRYFAEALVYVFTMVFSTFYHACDQEAYVFCLMRLSVMQFCDFYSAIFSFWVTLIAMADLPHSLYSLLHVAGAMIVALGVEYDRTGLWVFVVPSVSAFVVMSSSWIWHCKQQQGCFPSRQYWLTSLLPGVLLAASGLICYAFFETHDNYYYVHSVWHATMALAILCLLPPRRKKEEVLDEEEDVEPLSECEAQPIMAEGHNYSPVS